MLKKVKILVKEFDRLTPHQVANIYAIRYEVFVREQQSIYNEHDGHDFEAIHFFVEDRDRIVVYARVYKESDTAACLGRVAVDKRYRGRELGKKIVKQAIKVTKKIPRVTIINIEAQVYLQKFYENFGFESTSKPYDDDGVMHVDMALIL